MKHWWYGRGGGRKTKYDVMPIDVICRCFNGVWFLMHLEEMRKHAGLAVLPTIYGFIFLTILVFLLFSRPSMHAKNLHSTRLSAIDKEQPLDETHGVHFLDTERLKFDGNDRKSSLEAGAKRLVQNKKAVDTISADDLNTSLDDDHIGMERSNMMNATGQNFFRQIENSPDRKGKRGRVLKKRQVTDEGSGLEPSLPEELRKKLVQQITNTPTCRLQRSLGTKVELTCRNEATKAFRQEIPMMRLHWLLNGEPLKIKTSRMLFRDDDVLHIQDLTPKDTGVYECQAELDLNHTVTLAICSLYVTTELPTLLPRETEALTLDCHSQSLARVLRTIDITRATDPAFGCRSPCDLSVAHNLTTRQWHHNDTLTTLLPQHILAQKDFPDVISSATRNISGVWLCIVTHKPSSKQWWTGWYRVFVKDPPSDLELWWRSALRRPELVALVGLLFLITCIGVSVLIARYTQKEDENLELRWQTMKRRMIRKGSRLGDELPSEATAYTGKPGSATKTRSSIDSEFASSASTVMD